MTEMDAERDPPLWTERAKVWETTYVYRRRLAARETLPAVGVGIAVGMVAFYIARIVMQRTSLRPEMRPRSARLPEPRREPR